MKFTQEDLWETIQTLGWDPNDDIQLEIGGTSVYMIDGAGTKWYEELLWDPDDELQFTHDGQKIIIINKTQEKNK